MFKKIISVLMMMAALSATAAPEMPKELKGKTIKVIIPYAPGGDTDTWQRYMAEQAKKVTGLEVVILNKPGAGTIIGSNEAAAAAPDGTTLFGTDISTHIMNPAIEIANHTDPSLLQPVSVYAITPQFIYVSGSSNIHTLSDFVAAARASRGFNFGCSATHQCVYQSALYKKLGIDVAQPVMYKVPGDVLIGIAQGDIFSVTAGAAALAPHVQAGRLRAISVGVDHKLEVYPDADPITKVLPDFKIINLQMISAPAKTPQHLVQYWNAVYREIAKTQEFKDKAKAMSVIDTGYNVKQSKNLVDSEFVRVSKLKQYYNQ